MTHPLKERPLRVGPFTAKRNYTGGWWLGWGQRNGEGLCLDAHHVPQFNRLVAKMQAAETRRGDMRGSDADPAQKRCSQCGKLFTSRPCGPTHAAVQASRRRKVRR